MKYSLIIAVLIFNVLNCVAKSKTSIEVEESKVAYLCFLNEIAYKQLSNKSPWNPTSLEKSHIKNIDMDYYAHSELYKKKCELGKTTRDVEVDGQLCRFKYVVDLSDCSYQYDLQNGSLEKNKFSVIHAENEEIFESMLDYFTDFSRHVDWTDYNEQCSDSFVSSVSNSLKLKEIMIWQNNLFHTHCDFHFKLSRYNLMTPDFALKENDFYLLTGLQSNENNAKKAIAIFRASCCCFLEKYVLSQDRRQIFPYVQMSLAFKFCEEYFPTEFARLRQPPTEHPYYMGGGVFNSHKFHRFYDSFDSFFKNQKLSVAGLKEFLAKYVADENSKIFAMADGDSSTLQKDSIRIDIVTESTGILYSYKGDKCFAQPFEYSSKVDKNGQNIRHCKIEKVIAQSSDFLSFKVSDEFTITDDSELNFRSRREGKKCSYQLKLKVLTEEEVRMEM